MMPFLRFLTLGSVLALSAFCLPHCAIAAPARPTQTLGAFITPVDAAASSFQEGAGRGPRKLIDGSGWGETRPGSGAYEHTSNVFSDGNCMWNAGNRDGGPDVHPWLVFDLGRAYRVNGVYIWNYNESGQWTRRGVKDFTVSASDDGKSFTQVGALSLRQADGKDDELGQALAFSAPIRARFFRFDVQSNFGGDVPGLSEVRFSNAGQKPAPPQPFIWRPAYPRPVHARKPLGQPWPGAENIVYPADAGIVDVTQAPYNAKGDGVTDDTAAIQKALDTNVDRGAIIYLPNGIYLISDTLRWGGDESRQRNTVLQGQSRAGTILRLHDNCPGFASPRNPKGVIYTGHAPAQRFGNEIHNLTVDTGRGNMGACGIQFIANNQGGVYDVAIESGDGQGVIGLDLGYTDEQGPCLIKNVRVLGFDLGIRAAGTVDSEMLEHILLEHQNRYGLRNDGQPCTIRDLHSRNAVPALYAGSGFTTLISGDFQGLGAASTQPAIIAEAPLMARNVQATGYKLALLNHVNSDGDVSGPNIRQFLSKPASSLFGSPTAGLNLPVQETLALPWDDPKTWVSAQKFGAKADDGQDDSAAIQQAIDSGATTVYLPRGGYHVGHTIVLRGNVRRLIGCKAFLNVIAPLKTQPQPVFRMSDGTQPVVAVEGINTDFSSGPFFFMDNPAKRTLILRRLAINFQAADAYHGSGGGTVFLEDVVGRYLKFHHQTVWARQFNPEGDGTHVLNDGGTLWILGLKTEGGGTLLDTRNGGKSELLGSFSYTTDRGKLAPMFIIDNAQAALTFDEVCYSGDPFTTIVRETHGGQTRELPNTDPRWGSHFTLFTTPAP